MRQLIQQFLSGAVSRRSFISSLVKLGFTAAAASSLVEAAERGEMPEQAAVTGRKVTGSGGDLMVEQIKSAGTKFIFSNPGSYEIGFFDALVDRPELILIEGLHEGVVVSMADGFSRVSQKPAFVNVHAIAGTAQMAGQLYNAHRDGVPLVVTAGQANNTTFNDDVALGPVAGFHQTDINRQFTKLSWDAVDPPSIPLHVRRAYKIATTAPGGPVYLSVSSDAMEFSGASAEIFPGETFLMNVRPRPATDQVEALAKMLLASQKPVAIFGDEVWKSGAQAEAVELCELVGVAGSAGMEAYRNFPTTHPLYVGDFTGGTDIPYPTGSADLAIQIGARDWGATQPWQRLGAGARFAAVGLESAMIGRTQTFDLAIVADVKATLRDLITSLRSMATADRLKQLRDSRYEVISKYSRGSAAARLQDARANLNKSPIHPDQLAIELDQMLDPNAIVVSENFTGPHELFKWGYRPDEKMWMMATGTSLGWGIGAAIGAKLAAPDRQVVCSIGDGAVMYSASGFWTMKRYDIPLLTIVWNNRYYQTVRNNFYYFGPRMRATGKYYGLYIGDPDIDFVKLADSQGVRGERVTAASELRAAITRGIRATREGSPYVVEVVIARVGPGADSSWYQKYSAR